MQLPEEADETSISKRQLLAKLDVCMGGRVAEEIIFGEGDVTTGASSDIEQARTCIRQHTFCTNVMLDACSPPSVCAKGQAVLGCADAQSTLGCWDGVRRCH